jgi:hypothetical protein
MSTEISPGRLPLIGRKAYEEALDKLLESTQRSVQIFDDALSPAHNSSQRVDALRRLLLLNRSNRVQFVVHNVITVERNCPRLLSLLRQFPHAVAIHCTLPQAKGVYDPFAICDARHCVRRFHFDDLRGELIQNDAVQAGALADRFAELWGASEQGVSATTLGL